MAVVAAALLQAVLPPLRALDKGTLSEVAAERRVVVRESVEWTATWRQHAPSRAEPAVDFSREMVVGVFLGQRPTAGYSVEVAGYREAGNDVVVLYREGQPARDAITAQILTSPFHLVAIPRHSGAVSFEKLNP